MFKSMFTKVLGVFGVMFAFATNASAAITLPTSLDVSIVETWIGVILGALAVIWVGRKLVGSTNKS